MRHFSLLLLTVLCLGFTAPHTSADAANALSIAKLVGQLGSDDFNEREKASAGLDAIGEPALDALRQAAKSTDEEVKKRAETLVAAIEKRQATAAALKAKRVHLVYKDAPLKDALKDFEKQSGYHFVLIDPANKLKDRTVTLDTGDAPFWLAFDQFCDKAALKEEEGWVQKSTPDRVLGNSVTGSDSFLLTDGKAENQPTDAASAVCVRAKNDPSDKPQTNEISVALRFSIEPRLQWGSFGKVTVTKAIDEQKQELVQIGEPEPAMTPVVGGRLVPGVVIHVGAPGLPSDSIHEESLIRLKQRSEKSSKFLMELTGVFHTSILTEAKPIITAPDVLKAAGKTFKGGDNGQLHIVDISKNESGQVAIRLELQAPTDVIAAAGLMGGGMGGAMRRRGVRAAVAPGGLVAVRGAVVVNGVGASADGLSLLDDKGETIKMTGFQMQFTPVPVGNAGIANQLQYVLTFQVETGQEPAKLVYSGRKSLNVEIPFTLKDVALP